MRLVIATPLYPPDLGGPATYAKLLETGMPFDVRVVPFGDVRHYPKLVRHIVYFWKVYQATEKEDVILALDPVSVGLPALCAARLRRAKFIVKVVGDYAWEQGVQRFGVHDTLDRFVERKDVPLPVQFLRAVQKQVAKGAVKVIVPSQYLKRIVSAWGIRPETIEVIYNAIELEEGGVVSEAVSALSKPVIVTAGRLVPWKRVGGIIDAVASLPAQVSASLLIIGEGPNRQMLEGQAKTLLPERTVFTGALTHADTLRSIKRADVFVLNSTYEGLSHLLIEALMLGMPIVATNVGGNGELITHEENGLLIPASDTKALVEALERILSDTELRERISRNAVAAREQFSVAILRARTADLIQSI